jgi:hypothetical protein
MFSLSGFVKSLVSSVVTKLRKIIIGNLEQELLEICAPKVIFKTVLRGFIERKTINGISSVVVFKFYRNGELITGKIDYTTLEDDTYLIKAISLNDEITHLSVCVVSLDGTALCLEEVDLYQIDITDSLLIAMDDVYNLCHSTSTKDDAYSLVHD